MTFPSLLLIIGVLLAGVSVFLVVRVFVDTIVTNPTQALAWTSGQSQAKSKSIIIRICLPVVQRVILPITNRYQFKNYRESLKRNIQAAGLVQEINPDEYIGLQAFLGIIFPIVAMILNFLFEVGYPLPVFPAFGFFGFVYPLLYVNDNKKRRQGQIRLDLPFVVDLLALATSAGMDFFPAIQKVVDKMKAGPLAEELSKVLQDLKIGSSRADALSQLADRVQMPEMQSFVAVLVTADSKGGSIQDVLKQQSEQIRQDRFVKAEKAGAEASQKIIFPLVLFILPAVLLIVFGPVILQFMGGGK